MTNKKSTKKALVLSCLSLLLCMSMLVGTTFAWFTDSVSTTNNIITAGNLDVNLYWSTDGSAWEPVNSQTNIFKTKTLWEPGHTEVVYLRVVNEGTLALKYDLIVNVASEIAGTNVAGESFNLSDFILYKVTPGITTYTNSAEARGDESGKKLNALYSKPGVLEQGKEAVLTMVVFMPTTVGNEANYREETIPTINMGINLFATQYTHENDAYGPDYDADAEPVVIYTADELATALTSDDEIISVILGNSIDLPISSLGSQTPGSGEYKLGGENTEAIVIDLNGNKLNITTTYWSAIGAKNADAVINIKNGSMTSSQPTGTWNSYDVTFANCNYAIENVTFDKAIAFANEGKAATLKNVTINETHDYYALWITAEGQTVDINGLVVNSDGRGIKIDEQYVDAPEKVTLNVANADFNTNKKGAIMVKSAAGADINLINVDISNTPDPVHAVWVDEDSDEHYDLVTVTGGKKFYEGDLVTSDAELNAAIANGETTIVLGSGNYVIPNSAQGKTLTIVGNGSTTIATNTSGSYEGCNYALDGSTVVFENITINTDGKTYTGYARCKAVYNNCVINNTYCLYGDSEFNNCVFNVSGDKYNLWTWGAPTVTMNDCVFNSDGKALLLYGQANTVLTLNDCVFNDNGGLTDLKAAVEIGNDYDKSYQLIVNKTVVNGYEINDKGINTGSTLWGNKNSMPQEKLNVVINGVDVY